MQWRILLTLLPVVSSLALVNITWFIHRFIWLSKRSFFSGRTWVSSNRIRCFSLWTGPSFYGEKVMLGNKIFIRSSLKMVLYFRSQDLSLIRAWNLCLLESQTSGRQHFWISWGRRGLVAIRTRLLLVGQREKARRREVDPQLVSREAHKHAGNSLSNVLVVIP